MAEPPAPAPKHTNRLASETSPYLLQHAHNPVDWLPWGPDALTRARLLDRPIFLSIGYAACHWCHVMERESFEDETTAAFLNSRFIAIKVDREERPDLDQIYMSAVQTMTGGGGWPMSVFLTPDGRPFYGGTYFPKAPSHGLPSFQQVLQGIDKAWREQRSELEEAGARLVGQIAAQARSAAGPAPQPDLLDTADALITRAFDTTNGSWGGPPKFPQPMTIEFLLRRLAAGNPGQGAMVRFTLDRMADGGIRDQLGGGFHRYATDAKWLVPHFEQMLYDNAQLARVYLHAWAWFGPERGGDRYRDVATGVLDYILRRLTTEDGAFASSEDADTDGEEGATFTWRADEIRAALGDDAALFSTAYGVTDQGNWEGVTILSRVRPTSDLATLYAIPAAEVERRLAAARTRLLALRDRRQQPARDDKALAAWNGLGIGALADGARLFGAAGLADAADRYRTAATRAAGAILDGLLGEGGRLGRSWKDGRATGQGVLEDYANLAGGLLALYEATFDERWFSAARRLADAILERFVDPEGGFFDTATDHERLVTRPKDVQDNATPSGSSAATLVLLRLGAFTGDARYREAAERALGTITPLVSRYPTAFAMWLQAIDLALAPVAEVAIVGDPDDEATRALVREAQGGYAPNRVVALRRSGDEPTAIPLLEDRALVRGRPAAYVCRGFACRLPVTDPEALREQLAEVAATV